MLHALNRLSCHWCCCPSHSLPGVFLGKYKPRQDIHSFTVPRLLSLALRIKHGPHPRGALRVEPSGGSEGRASACNVGEPGSIPGSGRSLGEGNGNPLQYPSLQNPLDGGAWWTTVHGVAESQTRLSDFTSTFRSRAPRAGQSL